MSFPILCIHGIGHGDADPSWRAGWTSAIVSGLSRWGQQVSPSDITFLEYDSFFEKAKINPLLVAEAFARLMGSLVVHGVGDLVGTPGAKRLARGGVGEAVRWTVGMVAQWAADEKLRAALRKHLAAAIGAQQPRLVCAHSLGSLLAYDTFALDPSLVKDRWLVTFGSQIGNPAVRATFGGRLRSLETARGWFHLFNPEDAAFTASLDRFRIQPVQEVETRFDVPGPLDHDGAQYLSHASTGQRAWRAIAGAKSAMATAALAPRATLRKTPQHRALLVGINSYPKPDMRLEGCVNDTYLVSAALQELGFAPENIRVVLDGRATCGAIQERLEWLLDDADDGAQRVFFYSGHGAQVPTYGIGDQVDGLDECLVPHDFDWSRDRAFTDDQFFELYTQLPYGTQFTAIFDCCHSGGLTREGGVRARGLPLPDDIRHRALAWDADLGLWKQRDLPRKAKPLVTRKADRAEMLGTGGATKRLGRALPVWSDSAVQFEHARTAYGHKGPYVPLLLYACREQELAYEYRNGTAAYGAFTWCVVAELRRARAKGEALTFNQLVKRASRSIAALGYDQHPQLAGPRSRRDEPVPGGGRR
ncbi:caspase family protein [Candidatus Uhrbacteria bacterium]|nr:caspase family protein [Candidatus Uhrbacteria bacterium]